MTIPTLDASGKVVVVTGGSKGLGRAMALGFAEAGADVVVASRKLEPCEAVAEEVRELGRRALPVRCHVGEWDECAALIDATVAEFGRVDVLVNNAGIAPVPPSLLDVTPELFDKTIAVNLKGPLRLTALAAEHMPTGGAIINVSSKASLHPSSFTVVYAAAKAGLNALTRASAEELGPRGIRVNAIVCGTFHTDSLHASLPSEELQTQMAAGIALGRIASRRRDRRHRAVPRERCVVVPDRRAHPARRRLIAPDGIDGERDTMTESGGVGVIGAGRVAVVTGAASGIGRAFAERFAAEGSAIVVADLDVAEAEVVAAGIRASGGDAEAIGVDVSDAAAVDRLAAATLERFGRVDVLCNNAGVSTFNLFRDQTLDDWRWVVGVNLWGVVHGLQTFVPIMREQGTPGHIVNTASIAGLLSGVAFIGPYCATKVAVVSISETLAQELAIDETPIGVSVLCPSSVDTKVMESERGRPAELGRRAPHGDGGVGAPHDPRRVHRAHRPDARAGRRAGPRRHPQRRVLDHHPRRPRTHGGDPLRRHPRRVPRGRGLTPWPGTSRPIPSSRASSSGCARSSTPS